MTWGTAFSTRWHMRLAKTRISLRISPARTVFAWHSVGSQGPKEHSGWHWRLDKDAQTALNLCWAHMSGGAFAHVATGMIYIMWKIVLCGYADSDMASSTSAYGQCNQIFTLLMETITKAYLYNFDPLKPRFYIVKLQFTGVYIIFISAQKHR